MKIDCCEDLCKGLKLVFRESSDDCNTISYDDVEAKVINYFQDKEDVSTYYIELGNHTSLRLLGAKLENLCIVLRETYGYIANYAPKRLMFSGCQTTSGENVVGATYHIWIIRN